MTESEQLADVKAEYFRRHPDAKRLWDATVERRALGSALAQLRARSDLSQAKLAEIAGSGWDKTFVSRLESATEGFPTLKTLARYAAACGQRFALVTFEANETVDDQRFTSFTQLSGNEQQRDSAPAQSLRQTAPFLTHD